MSLKMQAQVDRIEARVDRHDRLIEALNSDLEDSAKQGDLFEPGSIRLRRTLVELGFKPPEPTALPDPDPDQGFE